LRIAWQPEERQAMLEYGHDGANIRL